jgi:integrase
MLQVKNSRERFLNGDEIRLLLETAPMPYRLIILIALSTGIRKEGVVKLKWSEIKDGTIDIKSKGGKLIAGPIAKDVQDAIARYRSGLKVMSKYVFPNQDNPSTHITYREWEVDKIFERLGWDDVTFHTLRHTFASHFMRTNKNIRMQQDLMGHGHLNVTERYSHFNDQDKREAFEGLSKSLGLGISVLD